MKILSSFSKAYFKLNYAFIFLFLFCSAHPLVAQEPEKTIRVFDRFGNEIVEEHEYSNAHLLMNPTVLAGYFELTFEDVQQALGNGFDDAVNGQARRDVAVQVFTDLSQLIVPANHPYTGASNLNQPLVKIKIAAWSSVTPAPPVNALGVASSYYGLVQGHVDGQIDGEVYKAINGGFDPWANLANAGMYPTTNGYHGFLAINVNNYPFHTDLSTPTAAAQYDLYTVMLHESMHMLDFASLISSNGSSTISFYYFYSRYDFFLRTSNGAPLVNITDGCYATSFTGPQSVLTPPAGCANNISFVGTQTHPVYAPPAFASGSSLSHFDDACPPNVSYVMTAAQGTGPSYMKRKPTTQEVSVLCDLGYETTNLFGTAFLVSNGTAPNTYSYDNTFSPCGERVGGVNDFYAFSNQYAYYSGVGGVPAVYNDFLLNDENVDHYTCLEIITGGGTLSGMTPTSFTYTPDPLYGASAAILRYIPVSASGRRGNPTFMFINVIAPPLPTCPATNCNLACNGDFEAVTQPFASPLGSFQITTGSNSPDLFRNNVRVINNTTSGHMGCAVNNFPMPHGGLQYVGIIGGPIPMNINNTEGMNFPLSSPMLAGTTYRVSFWARNHNPNCDGYIHLAASAMAPCPMPFTSNIPPATTYCGFTYTPYVITTTPILMNNVNTWTQFFYNYTPTVDCNYLMVYAQGGGFYSYIFLDDIEIHKTPMDVFAGADTTICNTDAATLNASVFCTDPTLVYSWSDGSGPVGSTSTLVISPAVTTTYTLTVMDPETNVSGTDVITVTVQSCTMGMNENRLSGLKIFPNPSDGIFTIQIPKETNGAEVELKLTSLLGETIYEKNNPGQTLQLNLSGKANGVYLLIVKSNGKIYVEKIILN